MKRYSIRIAILIILGFYFLSGCGKQQRAQASTLGEFEQQLADMLPRLLHAYRVPGVSVALVDNAEVVWAQGYGYSNEEAGTPVTGDTIFQVASISKSITAWGVMRLVEEGKIDLDAPVAQYLTGWSLPPSEFDQSAVTVRRLLSHTAGLAPWNYPGTLLQETPPAMVDLLSGTSSGEAVHLDRQPGERGQYTNGGYLILQLLVEDVTGEPFADYMQRAVLLPLRMQHSTFQGSPVIASSLATGYQISGRPAEQRQYPEAAGGLYSTASDIATWLAAGMSASNAASAGRNVLQPQTVDLMYAPVPVTAKNNNGLGVVVETLPDGKRMILHSGDVEGWRGQYTAIPDLGSGIVVLTNSSAGGRYLVADTICTWLFWAAGETPGVCQVYQAVYLLILILAGLIGVAVVVSVWRLVAQIRSQRRVLVWLPQAEKQRREVTLSFFTIAAWWLLVVPRLGALLPPTFGWITLAFSLWCLVTAARGFTTVPDEFA